MFAGLVAKRIPHSAAPRWLSALWIFHDPTPGAIWREDPRFRERRPLEGVEARLWVAYADHVSLVDSALDCQLP